mmetsp:Transcript_18157/g.57857  ORF Transcript_18157/g.57857 Transcript_18157/m.57857 type:complete len:275 (+) Transcript_18157:314-1138(+)
MRASPANRQYAPRTRSHHATVPGGVERGPACLVLRVDTTVATDMAVPLHYLPRRQTAVVMAIDDGHVLQHDWSRAQPAVTPVSECPVMAERPSVDGHVLVKVAPIAVDACWVGLVRAGHARDAHIRLVALEQRAKYHYGVRRRYNVILKKDRRRMVCKRRIKDLKPRDADANIHRVSVQRWPLVKRRRQRGRQSAHDLGRGSVDVVRTGYLPTGECVDRPVEYDVLRCVGEVVCQQRIKCARQIVVTIESEYYDAQIRVHCALECPGKLCPIAV